MFSESLKDLRGLPCLLRGKGSACQHRRHSFGSWSEWSPGDGNDISTPVFLPGKSNGQRILVGYSPWGHKELDTTEATEHACQYMEDKRNRRQSQPHQNVGGRCNKQRNLHRRLVLDTSLHPPPESWVYNNRGFDGVQSHILSWWSQHLSFSRLHPWSTS